MGIRSYGPLGYIYAQFAHFAVHFVDKSKSVRRSMSAYRRAIRLKIQKKRSKPDG